MNVLDVLKYGNRTVLGTVDGLPEAEWSTPNVCGWWSVKDIVAHLTSYECVLEEVLQSFLEGGPTPYVSALAQDAQRFNDVEVAQRSGMSAAEVLAEYQEIQARTMELAARIPGETWRQTGRLPWYGAEYDLEDFVCYQYYGHKREHCAQINVFRDGLERNE